MFSYRSLFSPQNQRVEILQQREKITRIHVVNRLQWSLFKLRTITINTSHYSILSLETSRPDSHALPSSGESLQTVFVRKSISRGAGEWEGRLGPENLVKHKISSSSTTQMTKVWASEMMGLNSSQCGADTGYYGPSAEVRWASFLQVALFPAIIKHAERTCVDERH